MYEANLEVALLQMEDKFGRWASNASGGENVSRDPWVSLPMTEGDEYENTPQQQAPSRSLEGLRKHQIRRSPSWRLVPLTEVHGDE